MTQMEELYNLDDQQGSNQWGIDKKIPIALIFVVIFQTVAITWGAATLSNEVKNYGEKITKLESNFDGFVLRAEEKYETREDHDTSSVGVRREIDDIKREINDLDQRLRSVEKTVK